MPCVNFSEELVAAFPKAKVVLTQREPEAWVKSIDNSIYYILSWRLWPFLNYIDSVCNLLVYSSSAGHESGIMSL
jgi:hypothetical protein